MLQRFCGKNRLGGEDLLDTGDEDDVNDNLEDKQSTEIFEIFLKYHNSIVGHFGISNTLKAMSMEGGGLMEKYAK